MQKKEIILTVIVVCVVFAAGISLGMLAKQKKETLPEPVQEPVVEEVVEEPPAVEEPAPRARRSRRSNVNLNAGFNSMMPIQQNGMPQQVEARENAIQGARDIVQRYRDATPEEKQATQFGVAIIAAVMNGLANNAGRFMERMTPEQREEAIRNAQEAQGTLNAIAAEFGGDAMSEEERNVFGGAFTSLNRLNQSIIDNASAAPAPMQ